MAGPTISNSSSLVALSVSMAIDWLRSAEHHFCEARKGMGEALAKSRPKKSKKPEAKGKANSHAAAKAQAHGPQRGKSAEGFFLQLEDVNAQIAVHWKE